MYKTILVPVDGSELSDRAVATAAQLATTFTARLIILHVLLRGARAENLHDIVSRLGLSAPEKESFETQLVPPHPLVADVFATSAVPIAVSEQTLRLLGERILTRGATAASTVSQLETRLEDGDSVKIILSAAAKSNADLIVMGSRGLGIVKGLLLGSVSRRITEEASCACLIVK